VRFLARLRFMVGVRAAYTIGSCVSIVEHSLKNIPALLLAGCRAGLLEPLLAHERNPALMLQGEAPGISFRARAVWATVSPRNRQTGPR